MYYFLLFSSINFSILFFVSLETLRKTKENINGVIENILSYGNIPLLIYTIRKNTRKYMQSIKDTIYTAFSSIRLPLLFRHSYQYPKYVTAYSTITTIPSRKYMLIDNWEIIIMYHFYVKYYILIYIIFQAIHKLYNKFFNYYFRLEYPIILYLIHFYKLFLWLG